MKDEIDGKKTPPESDTDGVNEVQKNDERASSFDSPDTCARGKPINDLTDIPAVREYLNRVGAEARSMKSAVIRETKGKYWTDVCHISFSEDGVITVPDHLHEEYGPTEIEQNKVLSEWGDFAFPKLKMLSRRIDEPPMMKKAKPEDVIEFRTQDGKQIIMCQVRVESEGKDGATVKNYVPFTYWDDDTWRSSEPDGKLPLWGLDQLSEHSTAFLHEGAKTAAYCRWMVEGKTMDARRALLAHPWGRELSNAAHIGWIGGALNPDRTDWSPLRGLKQVYVVTDNDHPGKDAVKPISKKLARYDTVVSWVRFSDHWPEGWDMADPMPKKLFDAKGRYTGSLLREITQPATWATRLIPNPSGKGRPLSVLRPTFANQWAVVMSEKATFALRDVPDNKYSAELFNALVRPFSDLKDTANLLVQDHKTHFGGLAYRPGAKEREIIDRGRMLNCHTAPMLRGDATGDPSPWLAYLEALIPNKHDRELVMRWLATLIARPEIRMGYGLLLFSETQGTGKTTLYKVLSPILGSWNCSVPSEGDVLGDYNGWLAEKRLVFVNEIYSGTGFKGYHKLKSSITEDEITISEKYVVAHKIDNYAHFILCSNSPKGLSLDQGDRRFMAPRITEELQPAEFWSSFYEWLQADGYAVIQRWAENHAAEVGPVLASDRAPDTSRKQELIEASMSPNSSLTQDLAEAAIELAEERGSFVALNVTEVVAYLKGGDSTNKVDPTYVASDLRKAGLYSSGQKSVKVEGGKVKRTFYTTDPTAAVELGGAVLRDASVRPDSLIPKEM